MRLRTFLSVGAVAIASVLTLTGCSNTSATTASSPETASVEPVSGNEPLVEGKFGEKPVVHPATGKEPAELVSKVLIKGDGDEVKAGDTLTVNYVGQLWDGTVFDSSFDRGQPATFALDNVIKGWTEGLTGKHVGDRVLLLIPSDKGYGDEGHPPTIPPKATLVFVVDINSRESAEEIAKKQEEANAKAKAEQQKLMEKLPQVAKDGAAAIAAAEKQDYTLPQGVTLKNESAPQPELVVSSDLATPEGGSETIVVLKGKGPQITAQDGFYYNVTFALAGEEPKSTWSEDGSKIQYILDTANTPAQEFVGMNIGSRVLMVRSLNGGKKGVQVIDLLAPITPADKK